jgi:hypothetical protein
VVFVGAVVAQIQNAWSECRMIIISCLSNKAHDSSLKKESESRGREVKLNNEKKKISAD